MRRTPLLAVALAAGIVTTGRPALTSAAADAETRSVEAGQAADDTGRNVRDRDGNTATADKQSNAAGDLELTRRIREAIVKNDSLSTSAHNVKIVTQGGVVTLRGPVVSAEERDAVAATAQKIAGVTHVDNQLEIASR